MRNKLTSCLAGMLICAVVNAQTIDNNAWQRLCGVWQSVTVLQTDGNVTVRGGTSFYKVLSPDSLFADYSGDIRNASGRYTHRGTWELSGEGAFIENVEKSPMPGYAGLTSLMKYEWVEEGLMRAIWHKDGVPQGAEYWRRVDMPMPNLKEAFAKQDAGGTQQVNSTINEQRLTTAAVQLAGSMARNYTSGLANIWQKIEKSDKRGKDNITYLPVFKVMSHMGGLEVIEMDKKKYTAKIVESGSYTVLNDSTVYNERINVGQGNRVERQVKYSLKNNGNELHTEYYNIATYEWDKEIWLKIPELWLQAPSDRE